MLVCTNCNQDPIFITEGIEIEEETDGSTLTVHNLQLEDQVRMMLCRLRNIWMVMMMMTLARIMMMMMMIMMTEPKSGADPMCGCEPRGEGSRKH